MQTAADIVAIMDVNADAHIEQAFFFSLFFWHGLHGFLFLHPSEIRFARDFVNLTPME